MKRVLATLAALALSGPVLADGHATGDAAKGEKLFKKCKSCHMIKSDEGEMILKGGKTGPNLWGVNSRAPGTAEGFKYGKDMAAAAEALADGWTQDAFVAFVGNPKGWLKETLDKGSAKSKMSFRLKKEADAIDVWTYLVSVSPAPEAEAETTETN